MLLLKSRNSGLQKVFHLNHRIQIPQNLFFQHSSAKFSTSETYSKSLNLPQTSLPTMMEGGISFQAGKSSQEIENLRKQKILHRSNLAKKWHEFGKSRVGTKEFVLHDGPPYANGNLHIGHTLNKVLKDIVNRYKILSGYKVNFLPGWDCHGLPIELKAIDNNTKLLTPIQIRKRAQAFASKTMQEQKEMFQSWGIVGDWENAYHTMDPKYEAKQLEVFGELFKKGYIYRGLRPVYWSPSSRTALAEAELEYSESHKSPSIYVKFPITKLSPSISSLLSPYMKNLHILIWTTTPWTLPANLAVCVNSAFTYCVVSKNDTSEPEYYIVAKERLASLEKKLNLNIDTIHCEFEGTLMEETLYSTPFGDKTGRVLMGDHVTLETGTGIVHTAPGHGFEDYEICQAKNILPLSVVDDLGKFSEESGEFCGLDIFTEGNKQIIESLTSKNLLILHEEYQHKYPYDWRTKKPIIIRTTKQWFTSLGPIQERCLEVIKNVTMIPPSGFNRLTSMLEKRKDWCISRQRYWGVPIPVFYDEKTDEPLINSEIIGYIQQLFEKYGSNCWWELKTEELLHPNYRNNGKTYKKGEDTMDVWFDSGTSWNSALRLRNYKFPADMYLEGSDQHRGWFQSSLLTSVGMLNEAPYKLILTHGFVLDEEGRKMSKSLGNVIEPSHIIDGGKNLKQAPAYGVDVLRLWVSYSDYSKDVEIGKGILEKVAEALRKIRNTVRYCLGNLYDFTERDFVSYSQLEERDKFILHLVNELIANCTQAYETFSFYKVYHNLVEFCTSVTSFYFEIQKDCLYTFLPSCPTRRSAQTVLYHISHALMILLAPIACHTSEEIRMHHPFFKNKELFELGWIQSFKEWDNRLIHDKWQLIRQWKGEINRFIEIARNQKIIRIPNEVEVKVILPENSKLFSILDSQQLDNILMVSKVSIESVEGTETDEQVIKGEGQVTSNDKKNWTFKVHVSKLKDQFKCPRCWKFYSLKEGTLCHRCEDTMKKLCRI